MTEYRAWESPKQSYEINGDVVVGKDGYKQKITGTAMGGLLNISPWATPFTVSAKLLGLWDEDISNKPQVEAGRLLERRIIDYAGQTYGNVGTFYNADTIFAKREGAHENWKSDFEDDIFAGHVDGIVTKDGEDYILEVKTASTESAKKWVEHPPEHYLWQVYLYNAFVTKQDKAYMLLGVLDPTVYGKPNSWIPDTSNTFLFEIPIDQKHVEEVLEELRQKYMSSVGKGCTLKANPDNALDNELMSHLRDIQSEVSNLKAISEEYLAIRKANQQYLDNNKLNFDKEEELKSRIKDIMYCNGLAKTDRLNFKTTVKTSFDFKSADVDGFDYSKYVKTTTVRTLTITKEKN